MKKNFINIFLIVLTGCTETSNNAQNSTTKLITSVQEKLRVDSVISESYKRATNDLLFDTSNMDSAPVEVLRSRLVKEDYSNYRNIQLTYKNVSKKSISAIKFRWYGLDAFGSPADMGNYEFKGFGGGTDDDGLAAGHISSGTWDILSESGKKIIKAWAVEVAFKDGTKWEAK